MNSPGESNPLAGRTCRCASRPKRAAKKWTPVFREIAREIDRNPELTPCRAGAKPTLNSGSVARWTSRERRSTISPSTATQTQTLPACSFGPEKVVAETAMLIYAASASLSRPNIASRVDHLARLLAPHARSERVLVDIALHPALAFKFAVPHILLTKARIFRRWL